MTVFRRRRAGQDATSATSSHGPDASNEELAAGSTSSASAASLPPQVARALLTLTTKMQQCVDRLDVLEHRLEELTETTMRAPAHGDVLEVRMHSAKLAAELARAIVELRGEIGLANDEARRAARLSRNAAEAADVPFVMPVDVDIQRHRRVDIDLTQNEPQGDTGDNNGWSASA